MGPQNTKCNNKLPKMGWGGGQKWKSRPLYQTQPEVYDKVKWTCQFIFDYFKVMQNQFYKCFERLWWQYQKLKVHIFAYFRCFWVFLHIIRYCAYYVVFERIKLHERPNLHILQNQIKIEFFCFVFEPSTQNCMNKFTNSQISVLKFCPTL